MTLFHVPLSDLVRKMKTPRWTSGLMCGMLLVLAAVSVDSAGTLPVSPDCDKRFFIHPKHGKQVCSQLCAPSRTSEGQKLFCRTNCPAFYEECGNTGSVEGQLIVSTLQSAVHPATTTIPSRKTFQGDQDDLKYQTSNSNTKPANDDVITGSQLGKDGVTAGSMTWIIIILLMIVVVGLGATFIAFLIKKYCSIEKFGCARMKVGVPETCRDPEGGDLLEKPTA